MQCILHFVLIEQSILIEKLKHAKAKANLSYNKEAFDKMEAEEKNQTKFTLINYFLQDTTNCSGFFTCLFQPRSIFPATISESQFFDCCSAALDMVRSRRSVTQDICQ